MVAPLFPEDAPLAPLPQRVMRHFDRYKVSFLAALINALLPKEEREDAASIAALKETVEELFHTAKLDKLPGDSFLARTLYFLPGHHAKAADIALLWYCFMEEQRRHLVTYSELKPLFLGEDSIPFHNYRHTLAIHDGTPALSRVYCCKAKKKSAREQIQRHLTEHSRGFSHWVDEGSYRLAVLVTSEERRKEIDRLISETYRTSPPLKEIAGITISVVPTEETFERMLGEVWSW